MRGILLLLTAGLLTVLPTRGQTVRLGATMGSGGPGAEVSVPLADGLRARAAGRFWTWQIRHHPDLGGVPLVLDGEISSGMAGVLLDFAPRDRWQFSAGLWTFLGEGTIQMSPTASAEIAGLVISQEELGDARFKARFPERPAPYLGAGLRQGLWRRLALTVEGGLLYTGRPHFEGAAHGRLGPTEAWQEVLNDSFSSIRWYPLLSLGLYVDLKPPAHE